MTKEKQIDNIERIIRNGEVLRMSNTQLAEALYDAGYRKQSEVAEEIFAEIEKYNRPPFSECEAVYVLKKSKFAELKKKYTEEGK